jgi:hypothetical protein
MSEKKYKEKLLDDIYKSLTDLDISLQIAEAKCLDVFGTIVKAKQVITLERQKVKPKPLYPSDKEIEAEREHTIAECEADKITLLTLGDMFNAIDINVLKYVTIGQELVIRIRKRLIEGGG